MNLSTTLFHLEKKNKDSGISQNVTKRIKCISASNPWTLFYFELAGYVFFIDIICPCYLLPVPAGTYAILDPASADIDQPD